MIFIDRHGAAAGAMCDALSGGDYVARLENELGALTGRSVVALASADAALHAALRLCGVAGGDYVVVPTFAFYSDIATVANIGAIPIFVDCDPVTRCVSPAALETALVWAELQDKPISAVVIDDAFGAVADYDVLVPLCKAHDVPTVELACNAMFGTYRGKPCGANCDRGVFALGKPLGGGGAVVCDRTEIDAVRAFSRRAYTDGDSYDYRLHNVLAAIDYAMLDTAKKLCARRRANLDALCAATEAVAPHADGDAAMYALCKTDGAEALRRLGFDVKTPPLVHTLPRYRDCTFFEHERGFCAGAQFGGHCLVDMDISLVKRHKLTRILKSD